MPSRTSCSVGCGLLGQQRHRRHHHARRAEAALEAVVLLEGGLDGVHHLAVGQALDGRDLAPVGLDGEHRAALHRLAVDEHGARAAARRVAADVGAGEPHVVSQVVHEEPAWLHVARVRRAVDGDGDLHLATPRLTCRLCRITCGSSALGRHGQGRGEASGVLGAATPAHGRPAAPRSRSVLATIGAAPHSSAHRLHGPVRAPAPATAGQACDTQDARSQAPTVARVRVAAAAGIVAKTLRKRGGRAGQPCAGVAAPSTNRRLAAPWPFAGPRG